MRAGIGQVSQGNGSASNAASDGVAAWSSRLGSFAALCDNRAAEADTQSAAHPDIVRAFRSLGILAAPLPKEFGGEDLLQAGAWSSLFNALRTIGAADLSIGRLFEGHCNAVDLVRRYGMPQQLKLLAAAIRDGAMSGVWGADGRNPLCVRQVEGGWLLEGGKILASGAGLISRPLVSASSEAGQRLVLLEPPPRERIDLSGWNPLGMRSSATGSVDLSGIIVPDACLIGEPGDFARQPYFSGGAWRFCAVHLGAVERLVDLYREQLQLRQRGNDPYQLQRIAACVAAASTTAFWIKAAARHLALKASDAAACVALSNLGRGVTERAALDVMEAVQRGIGLSGFIRPSPVERIARDLGTYLRQPVPDLAMADAARFALVTDTPVNELWDFDED